MELAPLSVFIYVETLNYRIEAEEVSLSSLLLHARLILTPIAAHISSLSIAHETFRPKKIFCQKEGIGEKISIYFSAAFMNSTSHDLAKKALRSSYDII